MNTLKLRTYQTDFKAGIYEAWDRVDNVAGVMATGAGKTVVFSSIANEHNGAALLMAHRKEINAQISTALATLQLPHRIVAPPEVVRNIQRRHLKKFGRSFVDARAPVAVGSVQTLTSAGINRDRQLQKYLDNVTLGIFDEGHHYTRAGYWAKAVERIGDAKKLFMTATPERGDGAGLGLHAEGFCEEMVEGPQTGWLIDEGYLSDFEYFAPESDLDQEGIPLNSKGELNRDVLHSRIVESGIVGDVVEHYTTYARGKRAIVFADAVETAELMEARFKAAGVRAVQLNGDTDTGIRDDAVDAYENNEIQVLINVDLFDEGFDVAGTDCVILARPTESLAKYLQMVGRALRVVYGNGYDLQTRAGRLAAIASGPKPRAILIDPVRNWERHLGPNFTRAWTLDGLGTGGRGARTSARICVECTQPYEGASSVCPRCHAEAPHPEPGSQRVLEVVKGDLVALDMKAMAALMADVNKANMREDDFRKDLVKKGVPQIGHNRCVKAHNKALWRRDVLKEVVAWWVGAQPGRDMREIHRRFYERFGIDIATAYTLDAKKTDALINRITERFTDDLPRMG